MSPAGSSVLLDTSVIIDHFRGNASVHEALATARALYAPTVVLGELYYGAFRSVYRDKQLEQVRRFVQAAIVVGTDVETSLIYGRIRSNLAQAGLPIPENDIWIAALAVQHELPLAARDQHFSRIPDLIVLAW